MKKIVKNKILAIDIFLIFLVLTLLPVANAFFIKDDARNSVYEIINEKVKQTYKNNNEYKLLIISPEKFNKELQPLIIHKINKGVPTKLENLNNIYEKTLEGQDNSEKIKFFIKKSIEEWNISYVLLVGGRKKQFSLSEEWWLPVRYIHIEDRWSVYPKYNERFISDLYFADIYDADGNFSSWDTNGNGVYGEWLDNKSASDILDLHPDVYLGRLPCRNILEVKIMVDKIINYEKQKCADSWFKRMVVVAGDSFPENDVFEGEIETQKALELMPDFDHIRLWASWGTLKRSRDVIREINRGCGFIYFNGHGSPINWVTYPPKDNETGIIGLDIYHMPFLRNREKLPICFIDGCHSSMFNISIFHSTWTQGIPVFECFSWRLTRKIGGGAIATFGNTGVSHGALSKTNPDKGGGSEQLLLYFFEDYNQNNTYILGEAWGNAIEKYLKNFPINWNENSFNDTALDAKIIEEWLLMGDPSLMIGGYP